MIESAPFKDLNGFPLCSKQSVVEYKSMRIVFHGFSNVHLVSRHPEKTLELRKKDLKLEVNRIGYHCLMNRNVHKAVLPFVGLVMVKQTNGRETIGCFKADGVE